MRVSFERRCNLCNAIQQEIFDLMEKDGQYYFIRAGWVCFACFPRDGAWHKAILRERTVVNE